MTASIHRSTASGRAPDIDIVRALISHGVLNNRDSLAEFLVNLSRYHGTNGTFHEHWRNATEGTAYEGFDPIMLLEDLVPAFYPEQYEWLRQ